MRNLKFWILLLLSAIAIAVVVPTVEALQISVTPQSPQLGDTISLTFRAEQAVTPKPVVTMDKKAYPAFAIAPNVWRSFLPTTPLDRPGDRQIQVMSAGNTQAFRINVRNRNFPTQSIWLDESGGSLEPTDYELNRVEQFKQLVTPQKFWHGAFLRPNAGSVSSGYGVRRYYNGVFANDYYHRGVDYAGDVGSAVVAPAAGQVRLVGTVNQGFRLHGNTVGIDHGQGVTSIFLHLSRINVKEGDFVRAGQVVGAVGGTGAATGPHLHWGLYVDAEAVDPVPWRDRGFS